MKLLRSLAHIIAADLRICCAIRLARGATGRDRIVKIAGCYHGHVDSLLVNAGSGVLTLGLPGSPGIPEALASLTQVVPYNDLDAVRTVFEQRGAEIACIIIEPVAGNMGVVPPAPGFLETARRLCTEYGALLAPETLSRARDLSAAMDRAFAEARQQAKKRAAS